LNCAATFATLRAMASLRKEITIDAPVSLVWGALRDVGALHTKLVPGFVTDTRMDGTARIVTFGNGTVAREEIVSVDDRRHRVCWAILDAPFRHYSASAWVETDGVGARFVWTVDLLPDELAARVEDMMDAGIQVIRRTLESTAAN
jgi:Polyketide cyclase / dehydrase and lipid transport